MFCASATEVPFTSNTHWVVWSLDLTLILYPVDSPWSLTLNFVPVASPIIFVAVIVTSTVSPIPPTLPNVERVGSVIT